VRYQPSLFRSFFLGGFECSTHRRADGRRLDLIAATHHDTLAEHDYAQLRENGIQSARDGVRWHLIETKPGRYDWSSLLPLLRAAEAQNVQVIWDLCHYGWPDWLDVWSAAFPRRFARFATAFAALHMQETGRPPQVCPVNEISFLSWAGGEFGMMNPHCNDRSHELKRQLVRSMLEAGAAIRSAAPGAQIFAIDPLINVVPRQGTDPVTAVRNTECQYQAFDMLLGQQEPELGGRPDAVDVLGVNFYWNNQWWYPDLPAPWGREALSVFDPHARPFSDMLAEAYHRYGCPIFVAETSIEGRSRSAWLRYVCSEVYEAIEQGVPVEGICLYPVMSHPGWDDGRYCPNGLFEMAWRSGRREVHAPLAEELRSQQQVTSALLGSGANRASSRGSAGRPD
jgi:beta-glucosidase/6-phospho-beta-glucosidase/beta-galactosidase